VRDLVQWRQAQRKRQNLRILIVSRDEEKNIRKFLASHPLIELPIVADPQGRIAESYNAAWTPRSYGIDRKGRLIWIDQPGQLAPESIAQIVWAKAGGDSIIMKHDNTKWERGFTLIEILVVIAILALLMGIVYAVLGPAREQRRQAACMSNLRQIGQALTMYRSDYDGADATDQPLEWWQVGLPPEAAFTLVDRGYIKDKRILHCPSEHDPESGRAFSSYAMDYLNWVVESRGVPSGRPPLSRGHRQTWRTTRGIGLWRA
jgi:prepilin-type N-terminal cleavage/methylation domain-containing protein